mmetsp:Transcript_3662/g.13428  ORF Transcript_3662/g.13428 Transcript_3662/m.13428 type:complete len:1684 (-) Transcript_3662:2683-7734(-)
MAAASGGAGAAPDAEARPPARIGPGARKPPTASAPKATSVPGARSDGALSPSSSTISGTDTGTRASVPRSVPVRPDMFTKRVYDAAAGDLDVFELVGLPIWVVDVDAWRVVHANSAALLLFCAASPADMGIGPQHGATHAACKELLSGLADGTLAELRPRRSVLHIDGKAVATAATPSAVRLRVSAAAEPTLHLLWTCHRETRRKDRRRGLDALSFTSSRYYTYSPEGELVWTNTGVGTLGGSGGGADPQWALGGSENSSEGSINTAAGSGDRISGAGSGAVSGAVSGRGSRSVSVSRTTGDRSPLASGVRSPMSAVRSPVRGARSPGAAAGQDSSTSVALRPPVVAVVSGDGSDEDDGGDDFPLPGAAEAADEAAGGAASAVLSPAVRTGGIFKLEATSSRSAESAVSSKSSASRNSDWELGGDIDYGDGARRHRLHSSEALASSDTTPVARRQISLASPASSMAAVPGGSVRGGGSVRTSAGVSPSARESGAAAASAAIAVPAAALAIRHTTSGRRASTSTPGHTEFTLSQKGIQTTTDGAEEEANLDGLDVEARVDGVTGMDGASRPTLLRRGSRSRSGAASTVSHATGGGRSSLAYEHTAAVSASEEMKEYMLQAQRDDVPIGRELSMTQMHDPHNPGVWYRRRVVKVLDAVSGRPAVLVQEEDVTELITAQRELEEALALVNARSEFVAELSHEIRTPLSGVMGMLDCLRSSALGAAQRDFVDTAIFSSTALLHTLDDALDARKAEIGKLEVFQRREPLTSLFALAEEVAVLMSQQAFQKGLSVNVDYPVQDLFSNMACITDIHRLRQVLINFASNSIKYTVTGSVTLRLTMTDAPDAAGDAATGAIVVDETEGSSIGWHHAGVDVDSLASPDVKWLHMEVADTGTGFDQRTATDLFKRFHRASADKSTAASSSGLGLAIAGHLALLLNGRITVWSKPGRGSRFMFSFPTPLLKDDVAGAGGRAGTAGSEPPGTPPFSSPPGFSVPAAMDAVARGQADDDDYLRLAPALSLSGHRMIVVNSRGLGDGLLSYLRSTGLTLTLVESVERATAELRDTSVPSHVFVVICDDGPEARSDAAQAAWLERMEHSCGMITSAARVGREARRDGEGTPRSRREATPRSSPLAREASLGSRSRGKSFDWSKDVPDEPDGASSIRPAMSIGGAGGDSQRAASQDTTPVRHRAPSDAASEDSAASASSLSDGPKLSGAIVDPGRPAESRGGRSSRRIRPAVSVEESKASLGASDGHMSHGSHGSRSVGRSSGRLQDADVSLGNRICLALSTCAPAGVKARLERRVKSQGRAFQADSNPALRDSPVVRQGRDLRLLDEGMETAPAKARVRLDEASPMTSPPILRQSSSLSVRERRGKKGPLRLASQSSVDSNDTDKMLATSPSRHSPAVFHQSAAASRLFSFPADVAGSPGRAGGSIRGGGLDTEQPVMSSVVSRHESSSRFRTTLASASASSNHSSSPRSDGAATPRRRIHISIVAPLHHIFDLPSEAKWFDAWLASPLRPSKFVAVLSRTCSQWDRRRSRRAPRTDIAATPMLTPTSAPKRRVVLVCDDNAVNRRVVSKMLASIGAGIAVQTARNGAEAVEFVTSAPHRYGLVLMDLEMPVLSGVGAAKAIRRDELEDRRSRTPIVALTAHAISGLPAEYRDAGFDDFMRKPVLRGDMKRMVDRWVGR